MSSTFNRPPLSQDCNGQPSQGAPVSISDDEACLYLPALRAAFFQLLAGNQTSRVKFNDQELAFSKGDTKTLQMEIRRLEILCGQHGNARAIRAGGYRPFTYPGRRFGGWPF